MKQRIATLALVLSACGPAPQTKDQAAILYRAGFSAEAGVVTKVIFPWIADGTAAEAEAALSVTDGGTVKLETTLDGVGMAVEGKGTVTATYAATRAQGMGGGEGVPEAQLTRPVPDAGTATRYVQVNKGGAASAQIEFEYTASRDCGAGCGGKRGWKYEGPVGLSRQEVLMVFSEEQRK
ncbi:MAG: hypothetical protein ACT4TC_18480 [Myxococcaceae bacterium]